MIICKDPNITLEKTCEAWIEQNCIWRKWKFYLDPITLHVFNEFCNPGMSLHAWAEGGFHLFPQLRPQVIPKKDYESSCSAVFA